MTRAVVVGLMSVVLTAGACARSQKPVLYPNLHLQEVGKDQADRDIEACRELAANYVPNTMGKEVAKDSAVGGVGGAAVGAVGGAVSGYGAGSGAAVGAATGAAAGVVHGALSHTEPTPVYKNYVDQCLREKGYEVIGWQ